MQKSGLDLFKIVRKMNNSRVWGGIKDEDWLGSVDGWTLTELGKQTFGWNWEKWLVGVLKLIKICKKVVYVCLNDSRNE